MDRSECGCVYANASNTASVRAGHEMGGYLKTPCAKHAAPPPPTRYECSRGAKCVGRDCPDCANFSPPPAEQASGEVDWRALYRLQTAMRYMDAMPSLTRDKAYEMADADIQGMESFTRKTP